MSDNQIWIEQKGMTIAVRWHSSDGLSRRIQTCRDENEARAFVAGFIEGLDEAQRILTDHKPRFKVSGLQVLT